jgi:hypothetical protein
LVHARSIPRFILSLLLAAKGSDVVTALVLAEGVLLMNGFVLDDSD